MSSLAGCQSSAIATWTPKELRNGSVKAPRLSRATTRFVYAGSNGPRPWGVTPSESGGERLNPLARNLEAVGAHAPCALDELCCGGIVRELVSARPARRRARLLFLNVRGGMHRFVDALSNRRRLFPPGRLGVRGDPDHRVDGHDRAGPRDGEPIASDELLDFTERDRALRLGLGPELARQSPRERAAQLDVPSRRDAASLRLFGHERVEDGSIERFTRAEVLSARDPEHRRVGDFLVSRRER